MVLTRFIISGVMLESDHIKIFVPPLLPHFLRWILARFPLCMHSFGFAHVIEGGANDVVVRHLFNGQRGRWQGRPKDVLHLALLDACGVLVSDDVAPHFDPLRKKLSIRCFFWTKLVFPAKQSIWPIACHTYSESYCSSGYFLLLINPL